MSDPLTTAIKILVLSLLAIAIPLSYHLGRNAPLPLERATMYCEVQELKTYSPGSMVPRPLRCEAAAGGAFLCKE